MNQQKGRIQKVVFLTFAVVLVLGLGYYFGFYKMTEKILKQYDTVELEDQLLIYQTRAKRLQTMQEELESIKAKNVGIMQEYNSLQKEIIELNQVFKQVEEYQFYFSDPTTDGKIVRRDISITFHTSSYKSAKEIIQKLYTFPYKSKIHGINIVDTSADKGIQKTTDVDVSLQITFYESITEESDVSGLQKYQSTDSEETTEETSNSE